MSNELDFLFILMFDDLLNGTTPVMSKSFIVHVTDAPDHRQQQNATPSTSITIAADTTSLNVQTTLKRQVKHQLKHQLSLLLRTFIKQKLKKKIHKLTKMNLSTSSVHRHPSEHRWTKDHPLEQVIGNPSQSIRTRRQLEIDGEMCMFVLTVSRTKPKNIKEAMDDYAWIEAMQE
uniref:Gag-Pol polyprotein n=1 Tax=Tanacetum cinerariifolium TaxID=118510 RepID=A0A6L2K5F3_TANCI|nr:Gag-Pol polyprotein [Tanacetum cinerariifolium]